MTSDRLWAPWRKKFITHQKPKGCIFCQKPRSRQDRKNLVLVRGRRVFSMLNLYPYNNGHTLLSPYRHVGQLDRVTDAEYTDLLEILN